MVTEPPTLKNVRFKKKKSPVNLPESMLNKPHDRNPTVHSLFVMPLDHHKQLRNLGAGKLKKRRSPFNIVSLKVGGGKRSYEVIVPCNVLTVLTDFSMVAGESE